ncbi:uncharacterized protein cubi_00401 [Cryptosporidium ubiquitum]|uniref:Uncharacterized protein n=1 Tax=Cryptosporidium ubiquitum TaxID=857276 RepID=A0A1J4MDV7_9CRYT|nr:uncharacterized protein cubi_00401 [Cryptosporidium ubiquitum]OII72406.1 hypothetical protein cubi_00401 [Cryptosporidium ubiquitum]
MHKPIEEKSIVNNREFLDINEEKESNGIEDLVLIVDHNKADESSIINCKKKDDSQDKLPPWKREPILLDNSILKRAKNFLSLCETVGNETVTQNYNEDKQVIMNVHMGVFDVNGKLPENSSLSNKDILEVPDLDFGNIQNNEFCQIEQEDDNESDYYEDDITELSFNYDPNSNNSLDEQKAIHNMLTRKKSGNKSCKNNKNLVQVISSQDNDEG